jgi:hypothetical protein
MKIWQILMRKVVPGRFLIKQRILPETPLPGILKELTVAYLSINANSVRNGT